MVYSLKTRPVYLGLALLVLLAVGSFCARQSPSVDKGAFPGELRLLEGYQHALEFGRDTSVGRIFKENGPSFSYDIGVLAGSRVEALRKEGHLWELEQVLAGRTVQLARHSSGHVLVSILQPQSESRVRAEMAYPANFFGEVDSESELVELLLMALSYQPNGISR